MFPKFNPGPDIWWLIPLNIVITLWIIYEIKKGNFPKLWHKVIAFIYIFLNAFSIFSQLFEIYLPIGATTLTNIYWGFSILGVGVFPFIIKKSKLPSS